MKSVAEQLAQGRWNKGLTVREVASALNLSPQTISFTESKNLDRTMVSAKTVNTIATFYGLNAVKIEELYRKEQQIQKAKRKEAREQAKAWKE